VSSSDVFFLCGMSIGEKEAWGDAIFGCGGRCGLAESLLVGKKFWWGKALKYP